MDPPPDQQPIVVTAIADTGCQSCLAGMNLFHKLCLKPRHLLECKMKMRSVNDTVIPIEGAILLTIKGANQTDTTLETKQMVYITKQCNKFYLSKDTCVKLCLVPKCFPVVASCPLEMANNVLSQSTIDSFSALTSLCKCPKRVKPPPMPTKLPFPA